MPKAEAAATDYRQHALRPIVLDAARAHQEGFVRYDADGSVRLRHPELERLGLTSDVAIPCERQFPAVRATFEDLRKLLGAPRSPRVEGGQTLSELYQREAQQYDALAAAAHQAGAFEPDYGSYVFDRVAGHLYLIAPERWHRLALVASNSTLMTDPDGRSSWQEIRRRLEGAVIGFAGASVGGNLLEGWLREARPKAVKLADPDRVEITNFNRAERASLRHLVGSRGRRSDPRDSSQTPRVSKAEYLAYEQQLVDPYLDIYVYREGLTPDNLERFLLGDGSEPRIDVLVEEMDHLPLKIAVREAARVQRIDVLMISDFGNMAHTVWNPFQRDGAAPLTLSGQDEAMRAALAAIQAGDSSRVFELVSHLCGDDFRQGTFGAFVRGEGEQTIRGLPQSGATAMASGAIGGKELALRVLGHDFPVGNRVVYDFAARYGRQG